MDSVMYDVLVIGGGLAGLALAHRLASRGLSVAILEASDRVGGLLTTVELDGFSFDIGGSHIIFSKKKHLLDYMLELLGDNIVKHYRDTRIFYRGQFVKYPFENGIYMLPPEERFEILRDVIDTYVKRIRGEIPEPKNFLEWIYAVFGRAIAEKYLVPYNEKLWKRDLRSISLDWVEGRVPLPPIEDIMKSAVGIPTEGYLHQLNFYYPRRGGIQALIDALLNEVCKLGVHVYTNSPVTKISREDGLTVVETRGGRELYARIAVSTAPLPETLAMVDSCSEVKDLLTCFDWNSLIVVGIGVHGTVPPYHWVYFPQREVSFHRIAFLSNYSEYMAPPNHATIIAEISYPPWDREFEKRSDKSIAQQVVDELHELKIIRKDNVVVTGVWRWKYAYIVYNTMWRRCTREAVSILLDCGVVPLGRFGSWQYLNMDQVIEQALDFSNQIVDAVKNNELRRSREALPATLVAFKSEEARR